MRAASAHRPGEDVVPMVEQHLLRSGPPEGDGEARGAHGTVPQHAPRPLRMSEPISVEGNLA
jgi:hypothetical protein